MSESARGFTRKTVGYISVPDQRAHKNQDQ